MSEKRYDYLIIGNSTAAIAAVEAIHGSLDQAKLSYVYRSPGNGRSTEAMVAVADPPAMPKTMPQPPRPGRLVKLPSPPPGSQPSSGPDGQWVQLSSEERAALEEIRRRKAEGYEVILIARSLSDPQARSEIFRIPTRLPK